MIKCPNCGGDVDALGDNKYRCKYCANTFTSPSQTNENINVNLMGGSFELPPQRYKVCPKCGSQAKVGSAGNCVCTNPQCGYRWNLNIVSNKEKKKALAPCPRCNSWNTNVENGIFYCEDCGFEGG